MVVWVGPSDEAVLEFFGYFSVERGEDGCAIEVLFGDEWEVGDFEECWVEVHGNGGSVDGAWGEFAFPVEDGWDASAAFVVPAFT